MCFLDGSAPQVKPRVDTNKLSISPCKALVGAPVGLLDGDSVGVLVGTGGGVGEAVVGFGVGLFVGAPVGNSVGLLVGAPVGDAVGGVG